jgi:hypothetical protein
LTAQTILRVIFGLIAVGVPFVVGASNILNHFYRDGAYLMDSGLLAYIMSPDNPAMNMPPALGDHSFYQFHVSPILWLLGQGASLLPLTAPQFFAVFIGTCHALVAAAVFWALVGPVGLRGAGVFLAAILAMAFALNGLAIAILRYPHYEMLIAAATMLFLVAVHERRFGLASLFMLVALLTREDGGFHIAVTLASIIFMRRWMKLDRRDERLMIGFLIMAFLYSASAMTLQHMAFPDQTSFQRIYSGDPAFGHVTGEMLVTRFVGWLTFRSYIFLPFMIAAIWSILRRNYYLMTGYLAAVPWLAVHLVAFSPVPGTLSSYYGFPLLVASFWPLLGVLQARPVATTYMRREMVIGFTLMIACSFTSLSMQHNPNKISMLGTFSPPPEIETVHRVHQLIAVLGMQDGPLGMVLVDDAIISLAPGAFKPAQTFWEKAKPRCDTVIYFANRFQAAEARQRAEASRLTHEYNVTGTHIRIISKHRLEGVQGVGELVERQSGHR